MRASSSALRARSVGSATSSVSHVEMTTISNEELQTSKTRTRETFARPLFGGVALVDGFGVRVYVERGQLVLEDGVGEHRRRRTLPRAGHGLKRVVCLNPRGYISFEALRWCSAVGIGVIVLGPDRHRLASVPRRTDDARLRRQQALAASHPVGMGVARYLVGVALRGRDSPFLGELGAARDLGAIREIEAVAADDYWGVWSAAPRFGAGESVPRHWIRFNGRTSMVSRANRRADRPVNAILNYLYSLLEAEAVIACHAVGLDPGLGIIHLDRKGRQSMALDLMEPVRPEVETFVAELLAERVWRARDFLELPDGTCRVRAPLTHELAETMPMWAAAVAPYAEKVAHMLGQAMAGKYTAVTPLTQSAQKRARRVVRRRKSVDTAREELWRAKYLPEVEKMPLRAIQDALGCGSSHASRIRRGVFVPAPGTWDLLVLKTL